MHSWRARHIEPDGFFGCLQAVENTVLLATTPNKTRAQGYNAMDFGRLVVTWAAATGRVVEDAMGQAVLSGFFQRQGKGRARSTKPPAVSPEAEQFGLSSATQVI